MLQLTQVLLLIHLHSQHQPILTILLLVIITVHKVHQLKYVLHRRVLPLQLLPVIKKGWGTPRTRRNKKYTFNTYYCTGTTRYRRLHDGNGGYFGEIFEVNSTSCGYVPPPAAGTVLGYFCTGVDRWKRLADGVGGVINELVESRSTICGYKPFGTLMSIYCDGLDKFGNYSDGEFNTYSQLIEANSRECGYDDGTGGSSEPGSGSEIDPNLPITNDIEGLIYTQALVSANGFLIYKKRITQPTTLADHSFIRPIQVSYDDN